MTVDRAWTELLSEESGEQQLSTSIKAPIKTASWRGTLCRVCSKISDRGYRSSLAHHQPVASGNERPPRAQDSRQLQRNTSLKRLEASCRFLVLPTSPVMGAYFAGRERTIVHSNFIDLAVPVRIHRRLAVARVAVVIGTDRE
jgi:hypothetical protein